jgi:methionine-gamma-lyase
MKRHDPVADLARHRHEFGEHGGVNMCIEASSTFTVMDPATMPELFAGQRGPDNAGCYLYGRHFNPTVYELGAQLAALEGTEQAYCSASGMSAISAVVLELCDRGDHVVSSNAIYGGTYALFNDFLPAKTGIATTLVDATDPAAVAAAITPRTRLIYVESLSNPTLRVADIPALARVARDHGLPLVVDNTFSPLLLSPARLGADVVVHSLTKFVSGASDVIAGAVCGSREFIARLMDLHTGPLMLLGPTMDPHVAFQLSLRLANLPLRMREHGRRALAYAERLAARGLRVGYPGLPAHPDYVRMKSLGDGQYGAGGVLTVDMGSEARANALMDLLQNRQGFGYMAVSLGYFDTLMSCSGSSTSSELAEDDKTAAGISPGLVRISAGITGTLRQRLAQLDAALDELGVAENRRGRALA